MSADYSQQPQRKPTGASDHISAGAHYGLEATNVSEEPSSFAGGRLAKLTISPQSSVSHDGVSYATEDAAPPLPPKVPAVGAAPRYATSRTGSVTVVPPNQPGGVLPPSPPRQRTGPPSLDKMGSLASSSVTTSAVTSPLTPPLTPQIPDNCILPHPPRVASAQVPSPQRSGSVYPVTGSPKSPRPLPNVPQAQRATGPNPAERAQQSPSSSAPIPRDVPTRANTQPQPSTGHALNPRSSRPQTSTLQQQTGGGSTRIPTVDSPDRSMTVGEQQSVSRADIPKAAPGPHQEPIRAATVATAARPPRSGPASAADAAPRAAVGGDPNPNATHNLAVNPDHSSSASRLPPYQMSPGEPRVSEKAGPISKQSPVDTADTSATGPVVPPKDSVGAVVSEKQQSIVTSSPGTASAGPQVPEKQQSGVITPGKIVASPQSTLNSTTSPPAASVPAAAATVPIPRRDRPKASPKGKQKAAGKDPINAVCYLDPCLKHSLLTVPAAVTTTADATLSAVEAYPEHRVNWTIGAPIGGLGELAKHYVLPPDAKFQSENGGITLTLAVVDEVGGGVPAPPSPAPDGREPHHEKEKGRTKARAEVRSDKGGIFIDIKELDPNRQIDLFVETRKGDVLILLPENYLGPIHVRSEQEPRFGSILRPQLDDVVKPYEDLWTTNVVPLGAQRGGKKNTFRAHKLMKGVSKYVPEMLRGQDDYLGMAVSSYTTLKKGDQSKILVKNPKGKVCFGLRGSRDERELREGIRVGAEDGTKKHWWS